MTEPLYPSVKTFLCPWEAKLNYDDYTEWTSNLYLRILNSPGKKSALGKKEKKRLQNAFLWNFKIEMQIEVNYK